MTKDKAIDDPLVDTEEVLAEALWRLDNRQFMCAGYMVLTTVEKEVFRYRARRLMKRDAVLVPVNTKFQLGQTVSAPAVANHIGVVAPYYGIIIGIGESITGNIKYTTQFPDLNGICFVFEERDLEVVEQ